MTGNRSKKPSSGVIWSQFLSGIYYLQVLITNNTYCAGYMYNIQCVNKHQSFLLFPIYLQVSITSTMKPQWRWFTEIWSQKMVNILKYLILLNQQPYELGSRNSELLLKYLQKWDWCQWIMKAWNCNTTIKLDYLKFYTKVKYFKVI